MNWGKTIIVLCVILLSIQIAAADTLDLTAVTNVAFADNRTVLITANLTDATGPVSNARVDFTTDTGILSASHNYTNASGIAVVNISSWDLCTANIMAQAPKSTNMVVSVTFVRGPISRIILSSNSSGYVNTTHRIEATAYDKTRDEFASNESRWRVMPNVTLNFMITPPSDTVWNSPTAYNSANITPSNTTDESGYTTAIARIDERAGTNYVNVNVTNEDGVTVTEYLVIVGLKGEAMTLTMAASPAEIPANDLDLSHITGKVTDEFGNPLLSTGAIQFDIPGSDPITKPLNSVGAATISIGPSKFTGSVIVNGTYITWTGESTNHTNSATVIFYAEEPAKVVVTADATKISTSNIYGINVSTIAATVVDKWGHTLQNRTVNMSLAGPGVLSSATVTTDSRGQAMVMLQSPVAGDATVTAKVFNDSGYEIGGDVAISIIDEPFISVITTIEPDPVEKGGIINVTTSVTGQGNITGTRLAAHAVLTLDRSGSMDPDYYAGTPLDVVLVLDRSSSMEFLGLEPEQPMTDAKTAAKVFMDNLASNSQVGVVSVASDHRVDIGLTLLNLSDNKMLIRDAIDGINAVGGTSLGDGLADASDLLINGRADARKITIMLSDGKSTMGNDTDCSNAVLVANTHHITIYTIGLGSAEYIDEPLLKRVASDTGGTYYNAPSSSELRAVYNSIAQEISDYDITKTEYGNEGFTLYNYEAEDRPTLATYILKFDAWDLDNDDECYVNISGDLLTWIPKTGPPDDNWKSFEYDISHLVRNGTNVVGFYDPHNWDNAIKNVVILENNITIAEYSSEVDLVKAHPYNCTFNISYYGFEDTFLINETLNDLKVLLQWGNSTTDLNLKLTSPSGRVYGAGEDTTGYYFDDREIAPIDIRASEFDTYIASASPDTAFAGETSFNITDNGAGGEQKSAIMRWKLPITPTHNAQIESVTMHLRGVGSSTGNRSINIYDLTTGYSDDLTWNCNNNSTSQPWASGGSFSSADNDSYLIDSVALNASISDSVVEFDITSANWSGSRLPDWGMECNIVLMGSGYGGAGADEFTSGETNPDEIAHLKTLNGYRPLVTITYSLPRDRSEYIWIHPLPYTYPDTDVDTVENGNWTVQVAGSGAGVERFNITTYIDKKSAAKIASHAFISSLDLARWDRVGLATYSYSSTNDASSQTSYVCEGNQWEGYFTVNGPGIYYFNLTWANATDNLDLYLYDGTTVLSSSVTGSGHEIVNATLVTGTDYRVVVNGTNVTGNDTQFRINVSSTASGSLIRDVVCAYRNNDSVPSSAIPRYRQLDGGAWSSEVSANDVGGTIDWVVMQSCPTRDEMIMGTLDDGRDINIQIWADSMWGAVREVANFSSPHECRGFDIIYEQNSSDAMIVYRGSSVSVPEYQIWNGSVWTSGSVNGTDAGSNYTRWVRLAAKPNSDEILLVTLDDDNDLRAQVWDGSAWGNGIVFTTDTGICAYQCFDVVYDGDNAMVAWAQSNGTVRYSIWDGASWGAPLTSYTDTNQTYWIKLASDPNTNNILMSALNADRDVHATVWNGSAWSPDITIEDDTFENDKRIMDVCFEQSSGRGMLVWGDSTPTPKYRIWDGSWSSESSASNISVDGYTRWMRLTPDPDSNEMFLMTSDGNSDINIQKWDGSAWGVPTEVETSSSRAHECFSLTYSQQEIAVIQTTVTWLEWQATINNTLTDSIVSFDPITASIDDLTADGMTAIDEGLYESNNALCEYFGSDPVENGTILLMTDGIDNVGYHSMIAEAERAVANNTTIFTVGFGSSIDDRALRQIANITGGEYYFAPNATVLKNIFVGIADELGNFTAPEPSIDIQIGNDANVSGVFANLEYINNSANVTYFTCNLTDCSEGYYTYEHPSNPNITYAGDRMTLTWDIGNRPDHVLTIGKYWNVTYQLRVDNASAGYVPVIISPSCVTYEGVDEEGNCSNNLIPDTNVDVVGNETNMSTKPANSIELTNKVVSEGPPSRPSPKPDIVKEYAYQFTASLKDDDGDPVAFGTVVEFRVTSGTLYDGTHYNTSGSFNATTTKEHNGNAVVWLSSDVPGTVTVCAYHTTENGTELTPACNVVIFHSVGLPPIIPLAPRPRGVITLESDPFMTDWISLLRRG